MNLRKTPHILITGASSGIGAALARAYAESGVTLTMCGRDAARIEIVAAAARAQGAHVHVALADVRNRADMQRVIETADARQPLDIVIANAGVSNGSHLGAGGDTDFHDIIDINLSGTLNTVLPALAKMQPRQSGHIAVMSSMAGFRGMPNAPAYSVAKCGVRALADALRPLIKADHIGVSCIHPGFVKTPLTDRNRFKMPFLMQDDTAARHIKNGIARNKAVIAFPIVMYTISRITAFLPARIGDWVLMKAPKK